MSRRGYETCEPRLLCARMSPIVDLQHMLHGKLGVALRRCQSLMAQQLLNRPQVGTFLEHVRAKRMPQCVRMHVRGESFGDRNSLDDAPHTARGEPPAALVDQ